MTKFRESELLAKKVSGTLSPEEQAELSEGGGEGPLRGSCRPKKRTARAGI